MRCSTFALPSLHLPLLLLLLHLCHPTPLNHQRVPLPAGAVPLRRGAPRRARRAPAGRLALATAVRMVHRVHRHAADVRAFALPAVAAGLAD
eukprot:CAMPEP_0174886504 /NCGR_PEP_ID=MMETSP0167-20121228/1750_1 /TAXON_ID=38298 /ORGANISM="Rhodella maculata, Strain CCMP736" /LENGTH=91 /DNA_ID=CAMNT_0016122553 /DNA_START=197 /DNA_END=469 /DNA_ORIENTATION=+